MTTYVVSASGDDANPGTVDAPFETITRGLKALAAGDVLAIRGGSYAENVVLERLEGTADAPIHIRPWGREEVTIDGENPKYTDGEASRFRIAGNSEWVRAIDDDPAAHPDEYMSRKSFAVVGEQDRVTHGAFVDLERYTRLITYARIEDLRATNQTFGRLPVSQRPQEECLPPCPGHPVVDRFGQPVPVKGLNGNPVAPEFKRPWVYMGPGLLFDHEGDKRIHIRLSHTENQVTGLADYTGPTDPRQVRLAISRHLPPPLRVLNCDFVRLAHLTVRFGGRVTIQIVNSRDVTFDHVRVMAASGGARLAGGNSRITFGHCEFCGGMPTWMFRSDLKDGYRFDTGAGIEVNQLGAMTSTDLLSGASEPNAVLDVDTLVDHCEFVDGHDLAVFGQGMRFHHNWIYNMNDEALRLGADTVTDLDVHHNAIMKSLVALNVVTGSAGGPRRIHYNLIDLREPTAGTRPQPPGHLVDNDDDKPDDGVFRSGLMYKSEAPDGPMDLFHNTCLVRRRYQADAGFQHYANSLGGLRRSFNNIYIDVEPTPAEPGYATTFLPAPAFHGPTDGNCMCQLGGAIQPLLRHDPYDSESKHHSKNLSSYQAGLTEEGTPCQHFEDSRDQYPPGFEAEGIDVDPQFRRIDPSGIVQFDDDLRLRAGSLAEQHGVILSDPQVGIDDPSAPPGRRPDIGCFSFDDPGLRVGVDGRRRFPELPAEA
jgi:hypothetical protein